MKNRGGATALLFVDSGRRGYHLHVHDSCVQKLDTSERREIADFLGHYTVRCGRKVINPNWVGIDIPITTDVVRMIRLPGTLNIKKDWMGACSIINRC